MADVPAIGGGLVLQLGGSRQYLPVTTVIEVLRDTRIVRVPGAAAAVRGMINHRGRILVVADAVRALELNGESGSAEIVIAEHGSRRFGIAVDNVVELTAEARTGLAELDLDRIAAAIFA